MNLNIAELPGPEFALLIQELPKAPSSEWQGVILSKKKEF
jgi:hypothetical protein